MSRAVHVLSQIPGLVRITAEALPECRVIETRLLRKASDGQVYDYKLDSNELDQLEQAEVVLGDPDLLVQTFNKLPMVKWYQSTWAGVDYLVNFMAHTGEGPPTCPFTRFSGQSFGQSMFEYCIAHLIMTERQLFQDYQCYTVNRTWNENRCWDYRDVSELSVAILGATGAIGSHMARRFRQLGSAVLGYGRRERPSAQLEVDKYSNRLEDILPECDCLISVLPSTPDSRGLLNNSVLSLCRKRPVLMNVGRGSVIAESEIIRALDNQWISTAILDVFDVEPLPQTSLLWSHPRVVITPHCSATTRGRDCVQLFADNYKRFINSEELLYLVDWSAGY